MQVVQRGNRLNPASQHTHTEREEGRIGRRRKSCLKHAGMRKQVGANDDIDPARLVLDGEMSRVLSACVSHMLTEMCYNVSEQPPVPTAYKLRVCFWLVKNVNIINHRS